MIKRKIVYCTPSLYIPGGIERVLTVKANYFADVLGYDIYIILTDGIDKKPYYTLSPKIHLINLNINFEELWKYSFIHKIPAYLKKQQIYKRKLKKTLFTIQPDITISLLRREINFINNIKDGSKKIGELHVNKKNYRNFENNHNPIKYIFSKLWMLNLIFQLKRLDQFIVLSSEDKGNWHELNNVKVISNPLSFEGNKENDLTSSKVIAVGRYVYQKGFDLLLKAWKEVSLKHPEWELHIYGKGDKTDYIQIMNQLKLGNTCYLEDAAPNIVDKYNESSIFVLSSRFEGFGMVIAEAMACGVPAVSFACPCGPRDIIKGGEDGLLVENGNIEELAEKICYLIENEDIRKEMGQKARVNIQRFKVDEIARQWDELFHSLLTK